MHSIYFRKNMFFWYICVHKKFNVNGKFININMYVFDIENKKNIINKTFEMLEGNI